MPAATAKAEPKPAPISAVTFSIENVRATILKDNKIEVIYEDGHKLTLNFQDNLAAAAYHADTFWGNTMQRAVVPAEYSASLS